MSLPSARQLCLFLTGFSLISFISATASAYERVIINTATGPVACDNVDGKYINCLPIAQATQPVVQTVQQVQPVVQTVQPVVQPVQPVQQIQPVQPVQQIQPVQPVQQIQPVQPVQQIQPVQPVQQIQPVQPVQQIQPVQPVQPAPTPAAEQESPAFASHDDIGGLFINAALGYQAVIWDHKDFKYSFKTPVGKERKKDSHIASNAVFTLSGGYNWKFGGISTSLDVAGGYGAGDFKSDSESETDGGSTYSIDWQFRDVLIGWFAGGSVNYTNPKFNIEAGFELGLTHIKIFYDEKYEAKAGETTLVKDSGFTQLFEETEFAFKFHLKADYFITPHFGMGLWVNYTFVYLSSDFVWEAQKISDAHLIAVQASATYRF